MATRETIYDTPGYTGLLIPHEAFVASALLANDGSAGWSDYASADRIPGQPAYDQDEVAVNSATAGDLGPSMALETTGSQSDNDYHVKVLRGGMPGLGATVIQRAALDSTAPWRGKQTDNVLGFVDRTNQIQAPLAAGTAGADTTRAYACTTTHSDTVLIAVGTASDGIAIESWNPTTRTLGSTVRALNPGVGTGGNVDVASYEVALQKLIYGQVVELVTLSSGRVLLLAAVSELSDGAVSGNMITLMSSYSDDDGASWRTGSYLMLDEGIDASYQINKLRACVGAGGSILLLVEYSWDSETTWGIRQYSSSDGGHTFTLIEDWQNESAAPDARFFDCVADPATGVIAVVYEDQTSGDVQFRRIASPSTPILLSDETEIRELAPGQVSNIAAWASPDGTMFVSWDTGTGIEMARSTDGGQTWDQYDSEPFDWGASIDMDWDVTHAAGRSVWMICDPASQISGGNLSFFVIAHTGEWDTLTHPQVVGAEPRELRGFDANTWLPMRLPSTMGWTKVGTGTTALRTTAPFGVSIETSAQSAYYEDTTTNLSTDGVTIYFAVRQRSGGSVTAEHIAVVLKVEDATAKYEWEVSVRFSGSQVRVVDAVGSTVIDTVAADITNEELDFKLAVRQWPIFGGGTTAGVTLYSSDAGENDWTAIVSDATGLTRRTPGGGAASYIRIGSVASSTQQSDWSFLAVARDSGSVGQSAALVASGFFDDLALDPTGAPIAPFTLFGAPLPALPLRLYMEGGLYITGAGGPATRGDTWQIVPDYQRPVRDIHPDVSASPRVPWRSAADNAVQRIGWSMPGGLALQLGSPSIGIAAFGCNVKHLDLLAWGGASWTTLGRLDFTRGMTGLAFTRQGSSVVVNTGSTTAGGQWIAHNELAGCTVELDDGGGTIVQRKIARNTEGAWNDQATRRPVIELEDGAGSDPASGTMSIWYQQALLLVHNTATAYTRYAIQIPAHHTADDYYEIGTVVIGPFLAFGYKYSRNRVLETAANYELTTTTDGTRSARKLGPARRSIEASWVEGFPTTEIWSSDPEPSYVSPRSGAASFGARFDSTLLEGIVERLGGAARPCVYVPSIPVTDDSGAEQDLTMLAGRERAMLVRLVDTVRRQTTNGSEVQDEVVTLAGLRAEEEL